jgi:hypothetical protein
MSAHRTVKSPNDYPLFGYRVIPKIKESLAAQLEGVLVSLNKNLPKGKKPYKKNDVFIKALELGFEDLKKTGRVKNE